MSQKNCLKDLVSGTEADTQIRCNQIWALSMPFTMLEPEKERKIVETVFEKLYTFYGMRTLEEADPEFHPYYEGAMEKSSWKFWSAHLRKGALDSCRKSTTGKTQCLPKAVLHRHGVSENCSVYMNRLKKRRNRTWNLKGE